MNQRVTVLAVLCGLLHVLALGCGGGVSVCAAGAQTACACADGKQGAQTCNDEGSAYEPCVCNSGTGGAGGTAGASTCKADSDCHSDNPCRIPACDLTHHVCMTTPAADGTPTPDAAQTQGNCHAHVCVGGVDTIQIDDSNVPATAADCDQELCDNGVPSNPPMPLDHSCNTYLGSQPGFCDGAGTCQQCAKDSECSGDNNDCAHPACVGFVCTVVFTAAGSATTTNPPQQPGDCARIECDGKGGTTVALDSNDAANDGNPCTTDACAGVNDTVHTEVTDGTHCGTNGTLACVSGTCSGCTVSSQCQQASCSGSVLTPAQTCMPGGLCASAPAQDCAPYTCQASKNACGTTCNTDADCASSSAFYCTGPNGTCKPRVAQGASCTSASECQTGHCVDGVCCNSACDGVCAACSNAKTGAANGTCSSVAPGTDPDNECTNQGSPSCGTTGSCGNGACALFPSGTVCQAASCLSGVLALQRLCNGSGSCIAPTPTTLSCAPYLCPDGAVACTMSCVADADCATGYYCAGGSCVQQLTQGSACARAGQCASGYCVDGTCCNNACSVPCQACSAAKKQSGADGTCGAAKDGQPDPRGGCTAAPPCGPDGLCMGGQCELPPAGTPCASQTCIGSTQTTPKACNGAGQCNQGGIASTCGNYLGCDASTAPPACYSTCLDGSTPDDARCAAFGYCLPTGTCGLKGAAGAACSANNECVSNVCGTTGVGACCLAACKTGGPCGATGCDASGKCIYPASGTQCGSSCPAGGNQLTVSTCDGAGACAASTSTTCANEYKCLPSGTACATSCPSNDSTGDQYCTISMWCNGSACVQDRSPGQSCTRATQCNGYGGTCCDFGYYTRTCGNPSNCFGP